MRHDYRHGLDAAYAALAPPVDRYVNRLPPIPGGNGGQLLAPWARNLPVSFAPMPASQTSGTVVPKWSFMGVAANGWVGWEAGPAASDAQC